MIRTGPWKPWKPIAACSISVDEIAVKTQREPADVPIRVTILYCSFGFLTVLLPITLVLDMF
jgi:hypothetical protein